MNVKSMEIFFLFHKVLPARRIPTIMYWGIQQLVYDNGIFLLETDKIISILDVIETIFQNKRC